MALTAAEVLSQPDAMDDVRSEYKPQTAIGGKKVLIQLMRSDSYTRKVTL